MFEIIILQNCQKWKQLLSISNGIDGEPTTRPLC